MARLIESRYTVETGGRGEGKWCSLIPSYAHLHICAVHAGYPYPSGFIKRPPGVQQQYINLCTRPLTTIFHSCMCYCIGQHYTIHTLYTDISYRYTLTVHTRFVFRNRFEPGVCRFEFSRRPRTK